ncbi:MFS transporter [Aneurinibacillus sp. Ricciae_BoGa-3]|uniref:MFS transporter n=1 Tax=Aneurinibacillus sp. Ricciae_BoGa-3 TaxID=3022697 RepID=UPI0023418EEC|nr:MFS transporter [Aneurinibacillus sp. Ricciae_BoGa-3]WCK55213.1 MFS transporter [Aneurinibacillus sp. Ricciae_BoGa-3]
MKKSLIVYIVSFAAFFGPFTQTIYTPMLPEIQQQFQTSGFLVNLTISIFTFVLALMQIIYGPFTDKYGRRKVLLPSILVYVVASIGAALSPSISLLLIFRALQAAGIAAGSVVATTVIGDLFEGKQMGRAMGTFQMLVALGPVVGPVVGGFVGEIAGFHGVFWVLAVTALLMWAVNARFLPETKPEIGKGKRFSVRDFSSVLSDRRGSAVIVLGFVQYYTFYNFLVFLPQLLTSFYGLSASQKGLVFLPMSLFLVAGSFFGGRLQGRFNNHKYLIVTATLNVAATVLFDLVSPVSLAMLIASISLFGLCLGLSLPVQTTLLAGSFQNNRATAIGVYNFFRYLGMAGGPMVGSLFYKLNNRVEFLFAALLFGGVVLFCLRQFFLPAKEAAI